MKCAWTDQELRYHPVATLCRVLHVSRSGFYAWQERRPSARNQANQRLLTETHHAHREHRRTNGRHRVARLRNLYGIEANRQWRFRKIGSVTSKCICDFLGVASKQPAIAAAKLHSQ